MTRRYSTTFSRHDAQRMTWASPATNAAATGWLSMASSPHDAQQMTWLHQPRRGSVRQRQRWLHAFVRLGHCLDDAPPRREAAQERPGLTRVPATDLSTQVRLQSRGAIASLARSALPPSTSGQQRRTSRELRRHLSPQPRDAALTHHTATRASLRWCAARCRRAACGHARRSSRASRTPQRGVGTQAASSHHAAERSFHRSHCRG